MCFLINHRNFFLSFQKVGLLIEQKRKYWQELKSIQKFVTFSRGCVHEKIEVSNLPNAKWKLRIRKALHAYIKEIYHKEETSWFGLNEK